MMKGNISFSIHNLEFNTEVVFVHFHAIQEICHVARILMDWSFFKNHWSFYVIYYILNACEKETKSWCILTFSIIMYTSQASKEICNKYFPL